VDVFRKGWSAMTRSGEREKVRMHRKKTSNLIYTLFLKCLRRIPKIFRVRVKYSRHFSAKNEMDLTRKLYEAEKDHGVEAFRLMKQLVEVKDQLAVTE
jgi:hypothetical protein